MDICLEIMLLPLVSRMNSTTLKWENTGIETAQHYYYSTLTFVDDICNWKRPKKEQHLEDGWEKPNI